MLINSLRVTNFRNYTNADISFSDDINIIIGENGQGKTNLIEAIYMLSLGRSFRTNKEKELMMFGCEKSTVMANVTAMDRNYNIEIMLSKDMKKAVKINSLAIEKLTDLLGIINIVIFSPEDLKLVREGPRERRSFMDREISQLRPAYYSVIYSYQKTLNQRNNLLKSSNIDKNLLGVYDEQLASLSEKIMRYRSDFIMKIAPITQKIHNNISSGKENLLIKYCPNIKIPQKDISKDNIQKLFEDSQSADIQKRTTTIGPHKDDISIFIDDMDLRAFGSQGQKRSAAISLKLSEIELIYEERNEYPIVLLDDIFSELDITRQKMLIDSLENIQTFVTTTESIDFNKSVRTYSIKNANISLI